MNRRSTHILAAVTAIFLAISLCLLGCGGSSNGATAPQAAPSSSAAAPARHSTRVSLSWVPV